MSEASYESDFVLWSRQQAEALARLRRGERPDDVDWDRLIDEVASLGRSETAAVASLLLRALEHLVKAAAWPANRHWQAKARVFLRDAARRFAPSMARQIDVEAIYADVSDLPGLIGALDGKGPRPLRAECPFTLDQLLAHGFDVAAAVIVLKA